MKILLVDDARSMIQIMTARLRSYGHEVIHAENGQIAVEVFRNTAPDLVLMDIEMPVMNGFEATNRIRAAEASQQWAWTPIIFLTASDTVDNLITAIEAGGDDFMAKTVPEPVLQAKMKAMTRIASLRQRLSAANRTLQEMADHDALTGLSNRRSLDLRVDAAWDEATRVGKSFAFLMLDIDNFKKFNDQYGHQMGDDCLRRVAEALAFVVDGANTEGWTHNALVARYGGEEFALLIPQATPEAYMRMAKAALDSVRALGIAHAKNDKWDTVTVSIGGVYLPTAVGELTAALHTADRNLYQAKDTGRNRVELGAG